MSQMLDLHRVVRAWAEASLKLTPVDKEQDNGDHGATLGYIDLLFAFGLATLGEAASARQLVESARRVLEGFSPTEDRGIAARFLFEAYESRIDGALAGKPHAGQLDRALRDKLDVIRAETGDGARANPYGFAHYAIQRMREQSRILEPVEIVNPYAEWMRHSDRLSAELASLPQITDPVALSERIRTLYRDAAHDEHPGWARFRILGSALTLTSRMDRQFAEEEVVRLVPEVLSHGPIRVFHPSELRRRRGLLLETALTAATYIEARDLVRQLIGSFVHLVEAEREWEDRWELAGVVLPRCWSSLRSLGLHDEIGPLVAHLDEVLFGGQPPAVIRQQYWSGQTPTPLLRKYRTKGPGMGSANPWADALRCLLHCAGGWPGASRADRTSTTFDAARTELLGPGGAPLSSSDYTLVARAYAGALGHGTVEHGLPRMVEVFVWMDPARVTNTFRTSKFYSRFHLNLAEEAVFAACRLLGGAEVRPVVV